MLSADKQVVGMQILQILCCFFFQVFWRFMVHLWMISSKMISCKKTWSGLWIKSVREDLFLIFCALDIGNCHAKWEDIPFDSRLKRTQGSFIAVEKTNLHSESYGLDGNLLSWSVSDFMYLTLSEGKGMPFVNWWMGAYLNSQGNCIG